MKNAPPRLFSTSNILLAGFILAGDLAIGLFLILIGDFAPAQLLFGL